MSYRDVAEYFLLRGFEFTHETNSPKQPLTAMDYNEQEVLFADLAKYIEECLR